MSNPNKPTKGATVRQILPAPIQGEVTGFVADETTGDVLVRVEWTDEAGGHVRHFKAEDVEVIEVTEG